MLKAIYIGDINYEQVPVFVYDSKRNEFVHENLFYHYEIVMNDKDWLTFTVGDGKVYPIENKNRVAEDDIYDLIKHNS